MPGKPNNDKQFRANAVATALERKNSLAVAKELGISHAKLLGWIASRSNKTKLSREDRYNRNQEREIEAAKKELARLQERDLAESRKILSAGERDL
ncbi:MAG: hypothetical protein K2W95_25255 [Candidatus Obscuribacterales bacterium]|nr:hypothetical protein [Candidatus Obscuribacterales bacterium]